MRTDPSWTVVFHEPALLPGMRRFSNAMKGVLAALALVLVSFGASAHAVDGPYVGIGGGLSMLNDSSITAPARDPFTALNANATTDDGFAIRGMAGYAFPSGFRVEAEIDYRRHNTGGMDVTSPGSLVISPAAMAFGIDRSRVRPGSPELQQAQDLYSALPQSLPPGADPRTTPTKDAFEQGVVAASPITVNGNFSMLAFMANVDYDFDTGSRWVPYVGGGLRVATISIDTEDEAGNSFADDSDTVFAYQVGAGLGYEFPLEAGRSVTVSLDWRYFATQDPTFTGDLTGAEFDVGISGHDVGISLIYGF